MYDDDLSNLDDGLRRLKIEYHIFFNGNKAKPPDDLRFRVEKLIKQLSGNSQMSFSQRFRLNTLVARFYLYKDLWRRTQQSHEMGVESKDAAVELNSISQNPSFTTGIVRISIADPKTEEDKVRKLYEALLQIKGIEKQKTLFSYPQFAEYLAIQTRCIREKYGCTKVAFTIALENGAIRFTAVAENRQSSSPK
jgi:hypothetical protein